MQTILSDDHEMNALRQCAGHLGEAVRLVVAELISFTKVSALNFFLVIHFYEILCFGNGPARPKLPRRHRKLM